jgi:hypothetical protein
MNELQPNDRRPGGWRIGERELQDGDLIEIYMNERWRVARYEFKWPQREYQLKMDGKNIVIIPGTQARMRCLV